MPSISPLLGQLGWGMGGQQGSNPSPSCVCPVSPRVDPSLELLCRPLLYRRVPVCPCSSHPLPAPSPWASSHLPCPTGSGWLAKRRGPRVHLSPHHLVLGTTPSAEDSHPPALRAPVIVFSKTKLRYSKLGPRVGWASLLQPRLPCRLRPVPAPLIDKQGLGLLLSRTAAFHLDFPRALGSIQHR